MGIFQPLHPVLNDLSFGCAVRRSLYIVHGEQVDVNKETSAELPQSGEIFMSIVESFDKKVLERYPSVGFFDIGRDLHVHR